MKIGKVLLILGAGAACVVTGGLAAPAIGAVVGTTFMGLSGAAATSAGLAALGGGEELKQALAEEAAKTNWNEETIRLLQDQLDDVLKTLEVANAA